jgi:LysR family glycine cleavage system transcriptional activator
LFLVCDDVREDRSERFSPEETGVMGARLPSLNALRAFEVAARHRSFSRAADELCVTHGAISRHIAILEETLGERLFIRGGRRLELTAPAQHYLLSVQKAFETLRQATDKIAGKKRARPLRIRALQTFVSGWLMPRLQGLDDFPVEISLATTAAPVSFDEGDVDLSIEAGASPLPNTQSYELFAMELLPVCHPSLVNGRPPPRSISDLANYTLLRAQTRPNPLPDLWSVWIKAIGVEALETAKSSYFPTFDMVYRAAIEGLGVGMGAKCFVEEHLASGALIAPIADTIRYPIPYFVVIPDAHADRPDVVRFRDWILNAAITSVRLAA